MERYVDKRYIEQEPEEDEKKPVDKKEREPAELRVGDRVKARYQGKSKLFSERTVRMTSSTRMATRRLVSRPVVSRRKVRRTQEKTRKAKEVLEVGLVVQARHDIHQGQDHPRAHGEDV